MKKQVSKTISHEVKDFFRFRDDIAIYRDEKSKSIDRIYQYQQRHIQNISIKRRIRLQTKVINKEFDYYDLSRITKEEVIYYFSLSCVIFN